MERTISPNHKHEGDTKQHVQCHYQEDTKQHVQWNSSKKGLEHSLERLEVNNKQMYSNLKENHSPF